MNFFRVRLEVIILECNDLRAHLPSVCTYTVYVHVCVCRSVELVEEALN